LGTEEEFEDLYSMMTRLSQASTIVHATGPKSPITNAGLEALDEFDRRFLRSSVARRRALIDQASGDRSALPQDVLTTLLLNQDALDLPADVVLREVAYYPWVGSHSTSNALAHAMDHIFKWNRHHPGDEHLLRGDRELVQRFVHESLRLHPPSPEALRRALEPVVLASGTNVAKGATVVIDVVAANRDPEVFGVHADEFDPFRTLPDGVSLWGLAFGSGFHACLGQELAGGVPASASTPTASPLFGAIAAMASILLDHGARPDPNDSPVVDVDSSRGHFGRYPILLD
jgi:cytochrome P450